MEVKSIKTIQNIGTFSDFHTGGSLRFEKLTFIYGYNTYGKTTITDIFQSIKDNNPNLLSVRKTIPAQSTSQKIEISIKEASESVLKYENNCWSRNDLSNFIEVFGSEFIHKNLFTGLKSERENKENFTQFILGEEGVSKANEISSKKKELGEKKRNLKNLIPTYVKEKTDAEIQNYLDISIKGLITEDLQSQLVTKEQDKQIESDRLKEPQKILSLPDIVDFQFETSKLSEYAEQINELLKSDYANIKDAVLEKLNAHITHSFSQTGDALQWIDKGKKLAKDTQHGDCPFCGQSLLNATELMQAYDSYFDAEYTQFVSNTEKGLREIYKQLQRCTYNYKSTAQSLLMQVMQYKEINRDENFQVLITALQDEVNQLDEDALNSKKNSVVENTNNSIEEKLKKPYASVSEIDFSDVTHSIGIYEETLQKIQTNFGVIKTNIAEFKRQYQDTQAIVVKISSISEDIEKIKKLLARIEQDQECSNYQNAINEINSLETGVSSLEAELTENQTQYLETYFSKINYLFQRFGSRNFTLELATSNRGHSPIYFLEVKFHNQKINDNELKTVFSESDRRALALAVFWAKVSLKPTKDMTKTVVVLDDPITSFDDNRIINTINVFKDSLTLLGQVIVLTHYPSFLKSFCERTKESSIATKFYKIEKDATTSKLAVEERETFTMSEYEKVFYKIIGFINREHHDCIKYQLRPFIESLYIPIVFAPSIKQAKIDGKDLSSLDKTIDAIFTDVDINRQFHSIRTDLNPDAHIFTSNNPEDVRNFASDMMNFLYSFEFESGQV